MFVRILLLAVALSFGLTLVAPQGFAQSSNTPPEVKPVLSALAQARWQNLEEGLDVMKVITPDGLVLAAYKISPDNFSFSVAVQSEDQGARAREIGEREGAVLVTNAGFFAVNGSGGLYPIGYLRVDDEVLSKGWADAGGTITFGDRSISLLPTEDGIPQHEFDVLQSRPMLIEPGGNWAMGSNAGPVKFRTLLCTLSDGEVILATITRVGLTLFEAGWLLRETDQGGFFGCDAAIALDGGRSTQVWHSGEPQYSFDGFTPVYSFLVVRQRETQ